MERIRRLREERGLTQVKLAVEADMNPATLNRIEQGKANPNLKTLERLADALGVRVAQLLEDDSPKELEPALPFESAAAEENIVDKVFELGELIYKGWEAEHHDRLEAGDFEWVEHMTTTLNAYMDVLRTIDITQAHDPEAVLARGEYMLALNTKFVEANKKFIEAADPEYRHRFATILEESGERMEELLHAGA